MTIALHPSITIQKGVMILVKIKNSMTNILTLSNSCLWNITKIKSLKLSIIISTFRFGI
jgi:hypothetical protein